ncbi:ubiquitin specific protease 14 [Lycorma delicatula]|uniref:ubiquitin specific protease 14 n=1 Tax=Lycorma delicatula TaxID=130591 RepID=UPI003F510EB1
MPSFKVKVKWGKEVYNDVEANTDEDPLVFKAQLFALTGVQPERQKVMIKGTNLKDADWGNVKLSNGAVVLMMGTREEDVPSEPTVKPVFVEDMNMAELASAMDLPAGLSNLGNTCYMNATVQCLKTVPELRDALHSFTGGVMLGGGMVPSQSITAALRDLYESMDKESFIPPIILLQVLHTAFPRFAEKSDNGSFMQQDANECWTEIVRMLRQKLPGKGLDSTAAAGSNRSIIDQYFGGTFDVELKCSESEDEPPTRNEETFLQLSCFIGNETKYMQSCLKSKMEEQITKHSPSLNRDATYLKTSKIKRLPAYLTINFVRFFYKGKGSVNAKILRDVKFPMDYDAFELCTKELQQKLTPMRERFKELEDKEVEEATSFKGKDKSHKGDSSEKPPKKQVPYWFEDDIGSNNSGYYRLQAVLTHKGRSSSSGHYVAWVRQKEDRWVKCDDDQVSPVSAEDVLKLSGGGDWHSAYVLLYGPRILELPADLESATTVTADSTATQATES